MALYKPKQLKRQPIEQNTETFVTNGAVDYQIQDLTVLSLDDLADRYAQIDQQSQLMKGLILLEARNRFSSNNEFGDWVKTVQTLCLDRQEVRTRYMNFARYFKDKERLGISLTAAYEISAPVNEVVADKIYEYALHKNLPVAEIKKQIKAAKKELGIMIEDFKGDTTQDALSESLSSEDFELYEKVIFDAVKDISEQNAIRILNSCIKKLRIKIANEAKKKEEFTAALKTVSSVAIEEKNNEQPIPASEGAGNNF
jgi:hypothetical protein